MNRKKDSFLSNLLFKDYRFIFTLWIVTSVTCGILKYFGGTYNNYRILRNVFWHARHQLPLYDVYPKEYFGVSHYGVFFSALIAPFSVLPNIFGIVLWVTANAWLLYYAIRKLPVSRNKHLFIYLLCIFELYNSLASQQFYVGMAALIILSYHLIEQKKEFFAAFFIMLGTFTSGYGVIGLAFLPFSKNKKRLIFSCLFWGLLMFLLPMSYTSNEYVWTQYYSWLKELISENNLNMFARYHNISLLGMVRKISGSSTYSDLWLAIPGIILFILPFCRIKQYRSKSFRMMMLASSLLFIVLFSTFSESGSYIIAMIAVTLWYINTPSRSSSFNMTLLIFAFFLTGLSSSDMFPPEIRRSFIFPFALKSLPCIIIWFKICYELCFLNFCLKEGIPQKEESPQMISNHNNEIDIVLPCYNPTANWPELIHDKMNQMNLYFPDKLFHLIVVNDGSSLRMSENEIGRFKTLLPNAQLISYLENRGKGYALRKGMENSCSSMAIYTNWNFPYDLESMKSIIKKLEEGYDVVVGARNNDYYHHAGLDLFRWFVSIFSWLLNWIVLGIRINDTQGGLTGMSRKGKEILLRTKINQFLFDTEFIYLASKNPEIYLCETQANLHEGKKFVFNGIKVLSRKITNFVRIAHR